MIDDSTFQKSYGGPPTGQVVTYETVEAMVLDANLGDNIIDVNATHPDTPLTFNGGSGADMFSINGLPSCDVEVYGGGPGPGAAAGDVLVLIGTGSTDGTYGPGSTNGTGDIELETGTGTVNVHFEELEPVVISYFATFEFISPNADDDVVIQEISPGMHEISGTSGGVGFECLQFCHVVNMVVDLAANDDGSADHVTVDTDDLSAGGVGELKLRTALGEMEIGDYEQFELDTDSEEPSLEITGGVAEIDRASPKLRVSVENPGTVLNLLDTMSFMTLHIDDGALVTLPPDEAKVLQVTSLSIGGDWTPEAKLDLGEGGLIVNYDDSLKNSPFPLHRAQILHARDQNAPQLWTGDGITSLLAAADPGNVEVTIAEATDRFGPDGGTFMGVELAAGDEAVLIHTQAIPTGEVVGRHIFYNNSSFDGNDSAPNANDDNAIAPDKQALMPGETATFANYTSYSRGVNGLMVDVASLPVAATLTSEDLDFKVGNSDDPDTWADAPDPISITIREDAGAGGSDRVTIIWADNAIQKQWLQVTVLATPHTGLGQADVFYFGNAIGESGNSTTDAKVNAYDMLGARDNPRTFINPALIDFTYDFNRDARVNAYDMLIARDNQTHFLNALKLITVPGVKSNESPILSALDINSATLAPKRQNGDRAARIKRAPALDAVLGWAAGRESECLGTSWGKLDWLYELEEISTEKRLSEENELAEKLVDQLGATSRS